MRILTNIKRLIRRGTTVTAVGAILLGTGVVVASSASAHAAGVFNCDSNAVIYCGAQASGGSASASQITARYNKGDGHNSAASIHNIYGSKSFNISSSDIQNLSKNAQVGSVTKSGDVMIGSKVVATNALTSGRQNIAGSSKQNNNGTTFYTRAPKVSFLNNSLSAYVVMNNGQFKFAILESCGNPVAAKPKTTPKPPAPKQPNYTINKEVAVKGSSNYSKSVSVKSGTHVIYRITVASTGNAPVTNLDVKDTLPAHEQYVAGTLQRDGKPVSGTAFFAGGVMISSLPNGSSTVFTFEAIVGPSDTTQTCKAETLNNVGQMTATSLPGKNSTATVSKSCQPTPPPPPQPVYACDSLTDTWSTPTDFQFTAKANASQGASITGYNFDFGDGAQQPVTSSADTATASHTYPNVAKSYTATVTVLVKLPDGTTKPVTSTKCSVKVTVTPPVTPTGECTSLDLKQDTNNPLMVTATAMVNTTNGATLTGASFDWGDGAKTPSSTQPTATHTYSQAGTFTVLATLTFSAPSGTTAPPSATCQAKITISLSPVTPVCTQLTLNVDNSTKTVTVTTLSFTANSGTFEKTVLDWGDQSTPVMATDVTSQTHTYSSNGPFTVVATPHFLVNGVDTPITSDSCKQTVSFTQTPTPPPTTPPATTTTTPPTQLVNTGVGNVAGLFAAAAILGTIGYRWFLSRRLSHDS